MKYKIGDKVKFNPRNGGYIGIEDNGIIRNVLSNRFYIVECTHISSGNHYMLAFSEKEIEDYA